MLALLLMALFPVFGQNNLVINGDFEAYSIYGAIAAPTATDYVRVNGSYVVEAGHYVINTTTSGHGGGQGWPEPANSNGKFMIVNGYGGSTGPSKVVWRQTVTVPQQTNITFSYRYVNLNRIIYGQIYPAKLQVKINGVNFGGINTLPTDNNWHDWNNNGTQWNSGTATQAVIEIYDTYSGNQGMGDDFCLDNISFVPDVVYSVDAVDDWDIAACQGIAVDITVLANDVVQPNANDASVSIVTNPTHGTATVLTNKKIRYTFSGGNYTTDQLKYRVTNHGVTDDAWVHINTSRPPEVANITEPGPICAGGVLGIAVPTVNPNTNGQWVYSASQTGTYQTFDPNNIPLSMNDKWVRYSASNECGEGHSNAVQITVTNGPEFTASTPQLQPICAGQNLSLTAPAFNNNGSQILSQGWVAAPTENGNYTAFNLNNIPASCNGWYIRYMVEGSCGYVYSNPARLLTVNVPPSNIGTLQAPEAICAGDDLELTAPTFDGTGTGTWEISQAQNGTYQSFNITNVPSTYDGWYLHYNVGNDCGNVVSNVVQIHVNEAPTIATPATPNAICAGSSFNLTTPTIQNNGSAITDQGWQIAATQNGSFSPFNNNNVQYASNDYWIRYYAVNECGETHSPAVQITVNAEPIVGTITAPVGICAGQSFNLTAPQVQWCHTNQGTGSWEIAPTSSGEFTTLDNNNIPSTYNGYYLRYKAVNGCGTTYSSNVVQVTVYSTDPVDEGEITACDAIYHHGTYCDHNGTFVADSTTANGCTIQVSWHFTLGEAYVAPVQYQEACDLYYWPKTQRTYYETNVYDTLIASNNPQVCDSTFTLNLTINRAPEIAETLSVPQSICVGSPLSVSVPQYAMNHTNGDAHWEYATSANGPFTTFDPSTNTLGFGTYYLRYFVTNECGDATSNVVAFQVNDVPVANMQLSAMQVCEGDYLTLPEVDVEWNNDSENGRIAQWQLSPLPDGTFAPFDPTMQPMQSNLDGYWLRFVAQNGCGTDIVGPVMITVVSTEDQWLETITACDSYSLNGQFITESTTVDMAVYEPCYHVVHQPVVINHSDYVVESITSCHETFEWHGRTFHHSEQMQYAWDTLQNHSQCDSIVELNLTFDSYSSYTHTRVACGSYEWEMNPGHVYEASVRDSLFVPAVNPEDCDTWYYLDLTIGHDVEIEGEPMTECSGFVWHGVPYYADAIVYDSLQTLVTHCDSIIAYPLTIIAPVETDVSMESCQPVFWNGHYFQEDDEEYTATLLSAVTGCDSIVTMHFNLTDALVTYLDTLACTSFNWHGISCDDNGEYIHTFETAQGCDSTVVMTVRMNVTEMYTQFVSVCDSTQIGNTWYTEPGNYYIYIDTIQSQNGCDSIIHRVNLTVRNSEQMAQIEGSHDVFVASNIISGIYRYSIDTAGIMGNIDWSISNPDWQVLDHDAVSCQVLVATPGTGYLTAHFRVADCGEMERQFVINAGFFGVDDKQGIEAKVYPNPTKGTVTIEAEGIESVRVVNMMGQVMKQLEVAGQEQVTLNFSNHAPSVYLLEIKTEKGLVKQRVVVCR